MATQPNASQKSLGGARPRGRELSWEDSVQEERDELHGVISVVYHALKGAEKSREYIRDARRAGEEELAEFFEECLEEQIVRADRGKRLLSLYLEEFEDEEDEER